MLTGYMWMGVASAAVAEGELVLYCMELGCSLAEGTTPARWVSETTLGLV